MEPRVTKDRASGLKKLGSKRRMAVIGLAAALVIIAGGAIWQFFIRPETPTVEKADPKQMALPLPELPSIAVLPFVNLSEDPKDQLLCDGITDNIINALSKVPRLFVIARNSTFAYKGKPVKVKQVSEELGVQYVMEGSVLRSGDRVRITAQLVDALTGHPLLAERYDGATTDLFALQDDITMRVLRAVRAKLEGLGGAAWMKYFRGTQGLDCFLKYQDSVSHIQRMTIADNKQARQILKEGLAMCAEGPAFYRALAIVNMNDYTLGSSKAFRESIEKAEELLQKALAIDDNDSDAHGILSQVYMRKREYDKAIASAERGVILDPGSSWAIYRYGLVLYVAGRSDEAIPLIEKAIRLNPLGPAIFYAGYGEALRITGRLEDAVTSFKKAIERAPNYFWAHANLSAVYSMMGRDKEAQAEAAEVLRINPRFSLEWYARITPLKDRSVIDKLINAMRKAGLPDKPSAEQP